MAESKEPKRFWSKVDVRNADECWEWQAGEDRQGYGCFSVYYESWRVHRVAWVLTYGPIPEGLCVCHKCDNPGCCNPYHLFLGTNRDNILDSARKGRQALKLTKDDILTIRELYATGEWTQQALAEEFGVHHATISRIAARERWGWLGEEK